MFKSATEHYKSLATFLSDCGIDVDIYPQGSFSLGTVVRPYKDGKDCTYDLDFICLLNLDKNHTTASTVKNIIGEHLKSDKRYSSRLQQEWSKCWSLQYAEINGVSFNMDVIPAVQEESKLIQELISVGIPYDKAKLSIAITNKHKNSYSWAQNNPKGYIEWFNEINKPFLDYKKSERRMLLFENNRNIYNSIEEVPKELERSSLQRAIQILKRHRDVYFSKINSTDKKPISAIITTIAAQISIGLPVNLNPLELVQCIVSELQIYSKNTTMTENSFNQLYRNKNVITKANGIWKIINPVNPNDNLADSWNIDADKAKYFFQWVKSLNDNFISQLHLENDDFINMLGNEFGNNIVLNSLKSSSIQKKSPLILTNYPKPYHK